MFDADVAERSATSSCAPRVVTAQGSPLTRLRRALRSGDAGLALAAAADCRHVELEDALGLCLLLLDGGDGRFERAALRWHTRALAAAGGVGVDEAALVLGALQALRGSARASAAASLAAWLRSRGLERSARVVDDWPGSRA